MVITMQKFLSSDKETTLQTLLQDLSDREHSTTKCILQDAKYFNQLKASGNISDRDYEYLIDTLIEECRNELSYYSS